MGNWFGVGGAPQGTRFCNCAPVGRGGCSYKVADDGKKLESNISADLFGKRAKVCQLQRIRSESEAMAAELDPHGDISIKC